jgi:tetracycline resistance efflux pump
LTESAGILVLLPPVIAVGIALWKKQLVPALFAGIWAGHIILSRGNVFSALFGVLDNSLVIAGKKSNLEIILFCFLIGSLLALIREANGFQGLLIWFEQRKGLTKKSAVFPLTFLIGMSIFIESWSSMLINGAVMAPLYAKLGIAREKLAYFLHTISLNFVAMIVINSWGAYYISLLVNQNIPDPVMVVVRSIPYNFYCLSSLVLVMIVMATGLSIGPMRRAERLAGQKTSVIPRELSSLSPEIPVGKRQIAPRAFHMIFPTLILILMVFWGLYHTGGGDIKKGSGSAAVFYAVVIAILATSAYFLLRRFFSLQSILEIIFKGAGELLPIGALLVFALTMGDVCSRLGTGLYLADLVKNGMPASLLPAVIFAISCVMSFSTGTAYGTLAIMVPIALPMGNVLAVDPSFMLGACVSGAVFGNNCSPISDTSIIASLGAGVKVLDHVKTQLPYAFLAAGAALVFFLLAGFLS